MPTQSEFSLSTALASASSLVLLQFLSRLFTFILNQALVRLVSPQVFGTAAIQFELLLSTILFLSREGVRNALLRAPSAPSSSVTAGKAGDAHAASLLANVTLLPVLIGVPTAICSTLVYVNLASLSTSSQPYFVVSVTIYALAAFCELLSEPLYIRAQNDLRFDLRIKAEGTAVVLKTVVTFVILFVGTTDLALVAFALGQATYGLTIFMSYRRVYQTASYRPRKVTINVHDHVETMYFEPAFLHLSMAMTGQSVVKHFLTEGDKFLISRLSPLADQGGYAVASNYGSLVARIVLQPIEETSRLFFSKTLTLTAREESLRAASSMLLALLLLFMHLLLFLVTFGPPYLPIAISILLPTKFRETSAPAILGTYVFYIPTMAFNGVLEAFLASASSSSDLHRQSRWMFALSPAFVVIALVFAKGLHLGDAGLVWANIVNLLFRAIYAWVYVQQYFGRDGRRELVSWRKVVPPGAVVAAFAVSAVLTRWSEAVCTSAHRGTVRDQAGHVAIGAVCALGCLCTCFVLERATLMNIYASLRRR
ncbi:Rft-1-domain-containing protein [Amylocystis lapponica]|nr:Rft-1-domain-containing protein [Amylocystis lapponica]